MYPDDICRPDWIPLTEATGWRWQCWLQVLPLRGIKDWDTSTCKILDLFETPLHLPEEIRQSRARRRGGKSPDVVYTAYADDKIACDIPVLVEGPDRALHARGTRVLDLQVCNKAPPSIYHVDKNHPVEVYTRRSPPDSAVRTIGGEFQRFPQGACEV